LLSLVQEFPQLEQVFWLVVEVLWLLGKALTIATPAIIKNPTSTAVIIHKFILTSDEFNLLNQFQTDGLNRLKIFFNRFI
jgi:hypothetical protein